MTLLGDLPDGHTAAGTLACLLDLFDRVLEPLRRSLTWGQGREMTDWQLLEDGLDMTVYFCDPHAPWQRPPTRTPTGNYDDGSPKAPTSAGSPNPASTRSPTTSTPCPADSSNGPQPTTATMPSVATTGRARHA
jgi:hypothetical protein